ncbi:hypothetical protein ACIQOU_07385 [Streptomyces sp. NPDC091279]|uniref:BACON domain-containing protein n=1 Tax=Streptomyces sp. NPDC091279 TaxID=3365983 RepID=UPI003810ED85
MSSSPETSTRAAGAHRARRQERDRGAARNLAQRPPTRYEPYLDGLFTYCLSVLCDHDTATAALGDALALAERRRGPDALGERRAWLYALARWACLRRLTEAKQKRQGTHASAHTGDPEPAPPALPEQLRQDRRRELALLAWPEAAGTTPEQREALELAVRHHLAAHEVAAVLGLELAAARDLLASAACEVERTRAALAVVESGTCPSVARLTGDRRLVLSPALRKELVRHVDDCPRCRRRAERAQPGWPGASVTPAELPVLEAPRAALHMALVHAPRTRGATAPRFDRRGFPMAPKDRAARRERLRARAVTTTVVATVVAAPVLAMWAAYRSADDGADGHAATAGEAHGPDGASGYQNAGNASTRPETRFRKGAAPGVSVEVISVNGTGSTGTGQLAVTAANSGSATLVTLTASGTAPVHWSAGTSAPWLHLSQTSGTLAPGHTFTLQVHVDPLREPSGHWSAQVAIAPAGAVVSIDGHGPAPTPHPTPTHPTSHPPTSPSPHPTPTTPPSSSAPPTPTSPPPSDPPTSPSPPDENTSPSPEAS